MTDERNANPRGKPRFDCVVDGIVLLDKPQGLSSNAALQAVRRLYRASKAGHAGSLDPLATGLLPLCFGQATKVCGYLLDSFKTYRVIMRLGQRTDSADADGVVIETQPVPALHTEQVDAVLQSFVGESEQVPPMFSALKVQGQRLYELARAGTTVERAARRIRIERMSLIAIGALDIEFEVRCSKGTYVRSLVEDVAQQLGTVAHVTLLRRLQVDPFAEVQMLTLETLEAFSDEQRLQRLMPADTALVAIPEVTLTTQQREWLFHGKVLSGVDSGADGLHRAYDGARQFLGLVQISAGTLVAERLFTASPANAD